MKERVFFIFIFFMFWILTGCSEKEDNRQIDLLYSNGDYIYDEVEMPADYLIENMCVRSENVYFIGTDQKKNGKKILVVKNKNGEMEIKEEIELDGFCRGEIEAFYKKEQGGYFALLKNNTGYEIMEMDEGGIITEEIELDTKGTDTLSMAQFDEDGNLYAGTYTEEFWNIVCFRKDGTLSAEAELSDGAYLCSVLVKGDKLYCTYYGIEKNIIIYEYQLEDLQNGKGKMSSVETYDTGVTAHGKAELILSEDIAYDFYVNDFSNVYAYSIVDKSSKKILNWTNTGLDGRSSEKVFSVSEESLLAFYQKAYKNTPASTGWG